MTLRQDFLYLVQCYLPSNPHGTVDTGKIQEVLLEQNIVVEINLGGENKFRKNRKHTLTYFRWLRL